LADSGLTARSLLGKVLEEVIGTMMTDDIRFLNTVRYAALAVGVLLVAGIVTLMFLARRKTGDEGDIAGVVAPALFLTLVSGVVAVVAGVRRRRAERRMARS
jgi:hypothetical protein